VPECAICELTRKRLETTDLYIQNKTAVTFPVTFSSLVAKSAHLFCQISVRQPVPISATPSAQIFREILYDEFHGKPVDRIPIWLKSDRNFRGEFTLIPK